MKKYIFREFVELINNHDPHEISSMITDDHVFTDAMGKQISGRDSVTENWKQYFSMFPDYWIEIEVILSDEDVIVGFGTASGTFAGHISGEQHHFFKIPTAFKAVTEGEKIKSWQVYADTKMVLDAIEGNL